MGPPCTLTAGTPTPAPTPFTPTPTEADTGAVTMHAGAVQAWDPRPALCSYICQTLLAP
ncbi:hypothetical protein PR001_g14903 [Phytophthora rubi]|nr:hypothetical protein PR001_g14903 [Phytophthora rubi]KAE9037330.1 hypothetical protein PR002_g6632 [Phytophthora rubi]